MTHDELTIRIIKLSENDNENWKFYPALRRVVELHKPQEITLPNGEWGANCVICDGFEYPCLTIRAIEKELK